MSPVECGTRVGTHLDRSSLVRLPLLTRRNFYEPDFWLANFRMAE
jgi:hypothetical protein